MEPAPEETLQTAVPVDPVIVAVNCSVLPTATVLDGALMEIEGGVTSVIVWLALKELLVESVPVTTTLAFEGMVDGAV